MTYIHENLKPKENVLIETKLHWAIILFTALWSWILFFIPLIYVVLLYITTEFAVTNQRVVIKYGILSKNVEEAPLDKIQNISLRQSFIGRLLGYGTMSVQTAATFGRDTFRYVDRPIQIKKIVSEEIDIYKEAALQRQAELIAKSMKST